MSKAFLVFPHQLFEAVLEQDKETEIYLVEEPLFFTQFSFHKKKLIFHRASMKAFQKRIETKGFKVKYLDFMDADLKKQVKADEILYFDVVDDWLEKKIKQLKGKLKALPSPGFYLEKGEFQEDKLFMASFYQKQRKHFDILMDGDKPKGGKYSFDTENRKKLPKGLDLPDLPMPNQKAEVKEAKEYVEKHFSKNWGSDKNFFYPIDHEQAQKWFEKFLEERFSQYGPYQDAITKKQSFLFHSLLSPLINAGLLLPQDVVEKECRYAARHKIPMNSLEGFVRQILGWREFVRGVYEKVGGEERTKNFWGFKRALPKSFWTGQTGIVPIDNIVQKVMDTSYLNHIERLMVAANFMLLCEINPDDVYKWFMELFIDAYDWVMVPNVYGMGEYADGGMIVTKPYISGSNYLKKMTDFETGVWCDIWDGLYWRFVHEHKKVFKENPRSGFMVNMLKKMDEKKLKSHLKTADKFLDNLA